MSENAQAQIAEYSTKFGQDNDADVRAMAAARLWRIGDSENRNAAEKIWKDLGLSQDEIDNYKHFFDEPID